MDTVRPDFRSADSGVEQVLARPLRAGAAVGHPRLRSAVLWPRARPRHPALAGAGVLRLRRAQGGELGQRAQSRGQRISGELARPGRGGLAGVEHRARRLRCCLRSGWRLARRRCAMLILSLVIQFNYLAFDAHLFWAALFGWYVVRGAGPISLDRIAGARTGRQRAAARGQRSSGWRRLVTRWLASPYLLSLRLWLAAALLVAAGSALGGMMPPTCSTLLLPVRTAAHFPAVLLVPGALLLALGLGTRSTARRPARRTAGGPDGRPAPVGRLVLDADARRCSRCAGPGRCRSTR